jgi:hypothetical protein
LAATFFFRVAAAFFAAAERLFAEPVFFAMRARRNESFIQPYDRIRLKN